MLNPDFIRDLRSHLKQSGAIHDFHDFPIQRSIMKQVNPDDLQSFVASEDWRGSLHPPARIFGSAADPSCLQGVRGGELTVPRASLHFVPSGRVIGNNFVLGPDGEAFGPSPVVYHTDFDRLLQENAHNHQGFAAERVDGNVIAYFTGRSGNRERPERAMFFHNLEPGNYGSFLFRQLPQLLLLAEIDKDFDVYIVPERTSWFREALRLAGLPSKPVFTIREIAGERFASIALFNEFDAEGFVSAHVALMMKGLARSVWPRMSGKTSRSIYVSRRLGTLFRSDYRPLVNEQTVEDMFVRRGFTVVHPETLSFQEQVSVFRSARAIAGPSGSGMLNAMFTDQPAKVIDLESFHYTVRQHAKIYSSSGNAYSFLFGDVDQRDQRPLYLRRWTVQPAQVEEAIEWLVP